MMIRWRPITLAVGLALTLGCVSTTNRTAVNLEGAYDKRIELGMNYLSIDKRDNARRQFSKALELKKNGAEAYHGIALVHQANGEVGPAADAFQKALRLADDKSVSAINVSYGKFLLERGQAAKACPYFEKAADDFDFTRRAEALFLAGQCAAATGSAARAKQAYEHALNLNNSLSPVLIELAEVYFNEGEYAKSKRLLDQFLKLNKPTARSLWLGIRTERIFGNKDKEASYAMQLKNLHPYSKEYLEYKRLLGQ